MVEEKKKDLQELTDRVHSGLDTLSDADLNLLFEEAEKQVAPTPPITPDPQQVSPAPTTVEPTPPVGESDKGQADLLNALPEQFRDKDVAASVHKMSDAFTSLQAKSTQDSQELSELRRMVSDLTNRKGAIPNPTVTETPKVEEVDDTDFFDKPGENSKKIAKQVFGELIREYDTFIVRRDALNRFKSTHSDFDTFQAEILEACKVHPEWDNDITALPRIYEAAKSLAADKARRVNPAPTINVEELTAKIRAEVEAGAVDKARQSILEEIRKRKAAAGITSSTSPTDPATRLQAQTKTTPMTSEEKTFDDMMRSGPKGLGL